MKEKCTQKNWINDKTLFVFVYTVELSLIRLTFHYVFLMLTIIEAFRKNN